MLTKDYDEKCHFNRSVVVDANVNQRKKLLVKDVRYQNSRNDVKEKIRENQKEENEEKEEKEKEKEVLDMECEREKEYEMHEYGSRSESKNFDGFNENSSDKVECVSVRDSCIYCKDDVSMSDDTLSVASRKSIMSIFDIFKSDKRVVQHVDFGEVELEYDVPSKLCSRVVTSFHFDYPTQCKVAMSVCKRYKTKFLVARGMKKFLSTGNGSMGVVDLLKKYEVQKIKCQYEVYVLSVKGCKLFVLIVEDEIESTMRWCIENLERMCDEKRSIRLAIDYVEDVNVLRVADMVLETKYLRFVFHNYRSAKYDFLCDIKPKETVEPKMFPKLDDASINGCDLPKYIVGNSEDIIFKNAMIEYLHVITYVDEFNACEYKWLMNDLQRSNMAVSVALIERIRTRKYNLYDNKLKRYVIERETEREYMFGYVGDAYVKYLKQDRVFDTVHRYILVTPRTEVMLNKELFGVLKDMNILKVKRPKIKWVNGVPRCGKTTYVINEYCPPGVNGGDLMLTITKEGARSIQERVRQKHPALPQSVIRANYRTVASYLLHGAGMRAGSVSARCDSAPTR